MIGSPASGAGTEHYARKDAGLRRAKREEQLNRPSRFASSSSFVSWGSAGGMRARSPGQPSVRA